MLHGCLVQVGKTSTDLQILGCELHKNAFGGRDPPGPGGGAIALPSPPSSYKGKGREERGRKGLGIVGTGKGKKGRTWRAGKEGKGKGGKGRRKEGKGSDGAEGRVGSTLIFVQGPLSSQLPLCLTDIFQEGLPELLLKRAAVDVLNSSGRTDVHYQRWLRILKSLYVQ